MMSEADEARSARCNSTHAQLAITACLVHSGRHLVSLPFSVSALVLACIHTLLFAESECCRCSDNTLLYDTPTERQVLLDVSNVLSLSSEMTETATR